MLFTEWLMRDKRAMVLHNSDNQNNGVIS